MNTDGPSACTAALRPHFLEYSSFLVQVHMGVQSIANDTVQLEEKCSKKRRKVSINELDLWASEYLTVFGLTHLEH